MTDSVTTALNAIAAHPRKSGTRMVVAIAGPPAAGKSTLAAELERQLAPRATVLGLDAFHFDNAILEQRGHRSRKGAPHTFDVLAYRHTLNMLRVMPDVELSVPVFDRGLELTRNCAAVVGAGHSILITEGNYLLLDEAPWNSLPELFDISIMLSAPMDEIEGRILQRWADHGLGVEEAKSRAQQNDLPNAHHVLTNSQPATLSLVQAQATPDR